jgi:hypothetical protein
MKVENVDTARGIDQPDCSLLFASFAIWVKNKTWKMRRLAEPRNLRALDGTAQYTSGNLARIDINPRRARKKG